MWIARDEDGILCLYESKPYLDMDNEWDSDDNDYLVIDESQFPEVTFENSPMEVELKLVNEIVSVAESPLKTFPRLNDFEVGASYRR